MNLERVNQAIAQMSRIRQEVECDHCFDDKYGAIVDHMIKGVLVELDLDDDDEGINFGVILDCIYNGGQLTEYVVHALGGEIEEDFDDACCSCGECSCGCDDEIGIQYDDELEYEDNSGMQIVNIHIRNDNSSQEDFVEEIQNLRKYFNNNYCI